MLSQKVYADIEKLDRKYRIGCLGTSVTFILSLADAFEGDEHVDLKKFKGHIPWNTLDRDDNLSCEFLETFIDQFHIVALCREFDLTEDFIDNHADMLNWALICQYQKLSEKFIEFHNKKISWSLVSQFQKLSEEFIEKHQYHVDWSKISLGQELSEDFIVRYRHKLNLNNLRFFKSKHLPHTFVENYLRGEF